MAILDRVRGATEKSVKGSRVPNEIQEKINRGREQMMEGAQMRRLCMRFWRGETYWYLNEKGMLRSQDTVTRVMGGGKPPHRIRNKYNYIRPLIQGKVSQATQRAPSYEIMPSTTDPNDIHAAELSRKVSLFGYDKWMVRRATIKVTTLALVQGEGFAIPYFDQNVGPFIQPEPEPVDEPVPSDNPETPPDPDELRQLTNPVSNEPPIGTGEVKVLTLTPNEVYWEPGADFYDSRWHVVERAMPIEDAEDLPGFVGGKLKADALTSEVPDDKRKDKMVLVTQYLERPCKTYKQGRMMYIANGQQITPTEGYPCVDDKGRAVDEPVIHRLSWTVEPDSHRDSGLVEQLIDLQRTIQDCWNKILEYKNRGMNPQMSAPVGSMKARRTDEPGAINFYTPIAGMKPEWEPAITIPQELIQVLNLAVTALRELGSDAQVQAEADVAARTVQAVVEQSNVRWATFIADLAEFHSRLMRHCLYLVSRHYTEERLIQIQGEYGPDLTTGFRGADLRSQVDVRVFPQSLQPQSQEAVETRATNWAQLGWIPPAAAMQAINSGSTDGLMQDYEKDVARMNRIIELMKQGPDALFSMPMRWDPTVPSGPPGPPDAMGQPTPGPMGMDVPGWMPRKFDNIEVQLQVLTNWMKGAMFERLDPGIQEAAWQIHAALEQIQQQREMEAQMKQTQMAEGLGMQNAAQPQLEKPMPDMQGQEGTKTPNKPGEAPTPPAGGKNG